MAPGAIVVVGGGVAAAKLVQAYRGAGGTQRLVVVAAESAAPYHRPLLPRFCVEDSFGPDEITALPAASVEEFGIDLRLGVRAVAIDAASRRVSLDDGTGLAYDALVVATGAVPRLPRVPGYELRGVGTFRTYADAVTLRNGGADPVVVCGGGLLGCELAASLSKLGRRVTILEHGSRLLHGLRCPELSRQVTDLFGRHGVDVLLGESVAEAVGAGGNLCAVRTTSGRELRAGRLLFATGVDPDNGLLSAAGAELDGAGCVVDRRLATTLPRVFAAGDVTGCRGSGHWSAAAQHGAYLGTALAGDNVLATAPEHPHFHVNLFDHRLHAVGDFDDDADDVALSGSIGQHKLLAVMRRDGRVVAGIAMGQPPSVVAALRRSLGGAGSSLPVVPGAPALAAA